MNLYCPSPASSVIDFTSARAAAGSLNSSTNFIFPPGMDLVNSKAICPNGPWPSPGPLAGSGRAEGVQLVGVRLAHSLDGIEGGGGLALVDTRHREADED